MRIQEAIASNLLKPVKELLIETEPSSRGFADDAGGTAACDEGDRCCSLARRSDCQGNVKSGRGGGVGAGEFAASKR